MEKEYYLGRRVFVDSLAAGTAGFAVTPIISAVDKALAENASGKAQLFPSFFGTLKESVKHPIKFIRSPQFFWVWLTYSGTYMAANLVETIAAKKKVDAAFPKWVSTSATNTVLCIQKDRAFAKLFGTKVAANVPLGSYAAWLGRDVISMGVFFTLPPIVGREVAKYTGSERSGYYSAQIALPLLLQFVTTPMHLLGYDVYNNPNGTVADRMKFLQKDYFKNVGIRMIRMAPPWSFGTIGNKEMRTWGTALVVPSS